jgi:hypothetical protein
MPNAAELAYLEYLARSETELEELIQAYRDYYDGDQKQFLSDDLRDFLSVTQDDDFAMNVCRSVISAVAERLIVSGFTMTGALPTDAGEEAVTARDAAVKALNDFVSACWQQNGLDARQGDAHRGAMRDGEYFAIVDKDNPAALPRITFHKRYVSTGAGGDGDGCKATYENNDPGQTPLYVSRRWYKLLDGGDSILRFNLYYPDRIEKYVIEKGVPVPFYEDTDPVTGAPVWPLPWVDLSQATVDAEGNTVFAPLGIPVAHFKNPELRSDLDDALPGQNVVNMLIADLLGSARVSAFRVMMLAGFIPTSDGKALESDMSNALKLKPGTWLNTTKPPGEVGLTAITGEDPTPMANLINSALLWFAQITDTPATKLTLSGQVEAEGTQKEKKESLQAKARDRQTAFGPAWVSIFNIARRLENVFGPNPGALDESVSIETVWKVTQPRDEMTPGEMVTELQVPIKTAWRMAGFSEEEIATMWAERQEEQATANQDDAPAGDVE